MKISAYFSQYLWVQRNPLCVILVRSCSWANASDHCVAQTIMTIWCSGGSELLTRCVLLLSRGWLPSEWPRAFGGAGGIGKEKAEAPGDARGSLVLLSVWAWLAVVGNLKQTKKSKKKRGVVVYCTLLVPMTEPCGRASSAATEMQQAFRGNDSEIFTDRGAEVIEASDLCYAWKEVIFFPLLSLGHPWCWPVGLELLKTSGTWVSASYSIQKKRWATRQPNSGRLSSTGMRCSPANCMRATSSSGRLWIPTPHTESPTSTTLHCTTPPATPWPASSGKQPAQIFAFKQVGQRKCVY